MQLVSRKGLSVITKQATSLSKEHQEEIITCISYILIFSPKESKLATQILIWPNTLMQ